MSNFTENDIFRREKKILFVKRLTNWKTIIAILIVFFTLSNLGNPEYLTYMIGTFVFLGLLIVGTVMLIRWILPKHDRPEINRNNYTNSTDDYKYDSPTYSQIKELEIYKEEKIAMTEEEKEADAKYWNNLMKKNNINTKEDLNSKRLNGACDFTATGMKKFMNPARYL